MTPRKSVECDAVSLKCVTTLLVGRQEGHVESWMPVCWWRRFDWSSARLVAPVVTVTFIILSSNKRQNDDILVLSYPDCPGKCPLNESCCCLLL